MRGERYGAVEGKTPEISVPQARRLLASITAPTPVARRRGCSKHGAAADRVRERLNRLRVGVRLLLGM